MDWSRKTQEAKQVIGERGARFKNIDMQFMTGEAAKDIADELTLLRTEISGIRELLGLLVAAKRPADPRKR